MQAVKTKEGKIEETGNVVTPFRPIEVNSEHDFKALGLASFFDTHEDNNVDWEEMFQAGSNVCPGLVPCVSPDQQDDVNVACRPLNLL